MIGLAPVTLVAAAGVVVFSGLLTASAGDVLIARSLAAAAAVLFASGYGLVMWGHLHRPKHASVIVCTTIAVGAVTAAALITAWQLLFVNGTVAAGARVALWVLIVTGVVGAALAHVARRLST